MNARHASRVLVVLESPQRISPPGQIADNSPRSKVRDEQAANSQPSGIVVIVEALDGFPALGHDSLIIVNADEEQAAGIYQLTYISQRLPHVTRVMQDTPRVHDVPCAEF